MNPQVTQMPSPVTPVLFDPSIPTVPIKLDRERRLLVNFNALAHLEAKTKRSVMVKESWASMKFGDVRLMLTVSLQQEDPTLTEQRVGKLLNMGNLPYVVGQVTKAWQMGMSGDEEGEEITGEAGERFRTLEAKAA